MGTPMNGRILCVGPWRLGEWMPGLAQLGLKLPGLSRDAIAAVGLVVFESQRAWVEEEESRREIYWDAKQRETRLDKNI